MSEYKTVPIGDFKNGQVTDLGSKVDIPSWLLLRNVFVNSAGVLQSRPILDIQGAAYTSISGTGITHDNYILHVADNRIYINAIHRGSVTSTSYLKSDVSRATSVFTAGTTPFVWNGSGLTPLTNYSNIFSLATFQGIQSLRLAAVSSDDKRKLMLSNIGNLNDRGTLVEDSRNVNDAWTEGYYVTNIPHEITDLNKRLGEVIIFTKQAIYQMQETVKDFGFSVQLIKVADIEVWPGKTVKMPDNSILFVNSNGIHTYPGFNRIDMNGIEQSIINSLVYNETRLSYDMERELLYLMPSNNSNKTWVYNLRAKHWTEWDISVYDCTTVNNTYMASAYSGNKYLAIGRDTLSGNINSIDITIQAGLSSFGNVNTRKIFKGIAMDIKTDSNIDYFIDMFTEEIPDNPAVVFNQDIVPLSNINTKIFKKGNRGAPYIRIKAKNKVLFHDISLEVFEKDPRTGYRSV